MEISINGTKEELRAVSMLLDTPDMCDLVTDNEVVFRMSLHKPEKLTQPRRKGAERTAVPSKPAVLMPKMRKMLDVSSGNVLRYLDVVYDAGTQGITDAALRRATRKKKLGPIRAAVNRAQRKAGLTSEEVFTTTTLRGTRYVALTPLFRKAVEAFRVPASA